jgi:hypothetical protein
MKLLFVSRLERWARAVSAITRYVAVARRLGHEAAMFGEPHADFSSIPYSTDVKAFDFAIFVIYEALDFPDLPYLAYLLDGMPKERRVIIDCSGVYNKTISIEHDSNHFEQLNGHQGWEWVESFSAVANKILQPTVRPLRQDVIPFLFFGFDSSAVARHYSSPHDAAAAWSAKNGAGKPYGIAYVGHNWQRWNQLRLFFETVQPVKDQLNTMQLRGWGWDCRPDWAVQHEFAGVDVDPTLLRGLGVEIGETLPFSEVIEFQGRAKFCPIIHRPLYNELGLVTNRTFETFCSDTIPILLLPPSTVLEIHGPDALSLTPGSEGLVARLHDMIDRPAVYWDAVLKTRSHLAAQHSYERRLEQLLAILEN